MDRVVHERHRKLDVRNVRYHDGLMMAILWRRAFRCGNLAQIRVGSHISNIERVYVCSFTAAETKNRRELQLAPSKVPETGPGERAAQKVDLLRTAVPAVEQEPPAADIEMAVPQAVGSAAELAHELSRQRLRRLAVKVTLALVDDCVPSLSWL